MAEQNRPERLTMLSRMTTPQLEHMLLLSLQSDMDAETVQSILGVLHARKGSDGETALHALEKLGKYYNTPDGEGQELYSSCDPQSTPRRSKGRRLRWLMRVAACCVIVLSVMIAVQATGVDIFGTVAEWTDSIFHYSVSENGNVPSTAAQTAALAESEIQLALADVGMSANLAPTWVPEGYTLVKLKQVDTLISTGVCATFLNESGNRFSVDIQTSDSAQNVEELMFEKDVTNVETIVSNSRMFYVFSNTAGWSGVWSDGKYTVSVTGVDTKDNIISIIEQLGG